MMKMLIKFDEQKVEREGKYDLEKMNKVIDKEFLDMGVTKDENGVYVNGDFESFGSMIFALKEIDWFVENVSEWLWYDSGFISNPTPDEYLVEDLIARYCNRRKEI